MSFSRPFPTLFRPNYSRRCWRRRKDSILTSHGPCPKSRARCEKSSETFMQFIEKNSFNVRSAVYHLKKQGFGPQFILFPMIHVGDRNFLVEVSQRLAQCDLILAEGVASKSAALLTSAYRIVRKVHRLDLITQYEMDTSKLKDKMVNADMEPEDFDRQYSTLPTLVRLQVFVLFPFFALYLLLCGTRQIIARELAVEDLPSSEEIL